MTDDEADGRHAAALERTRRQYQKAEEEVIAYRRHMAHAARAAHLDGMSLARIGKWLHRTPEGVRQLLRWLERDEAS